MRVPTASTRFMSVGLMGRGGSRVGSLAMAGLVARRGFASSERRAETWGFIGLGRMGMFHRGEQDFYTVPPPSIRSGASIQSETDH